MSLDLIIVNETCKVCGKYESDSFNCTYNLSPMWYALFPEDTNMVPIEGMTGAQAAPLIESAINGAGIHKNKLMRLEPENGWGSFEVFVEFLINVLGACKTMPNGVWSASR